MLLKKPFFWLLAACLLCLSISAHAATDSDEPQSSETNDSSRASSSFRTLWLVEGRGADAQEQRLRSVLSSSPGSRHLVGEQGILEAVEHNGLDVPDCLDGTGACENQRAAAMRALRVERFVHLNILRRGQVEASVYNEEGHVVRQFTSQQSSTQHAVMSALSDITDATGRLRIDSTPEGATVFIDEKEVGQTPLDRTMNVGSYDIQVRLPGYGSVHETVDVPPEGRARRTFSLERRAATLVVRSGTPTATVRIDDRPERLPTNEALLVESGHHRITVEADGYESVSEHFDFQPGKKRELNATLALSMREISTRHRQRIIDRPILVQGGLRYMHYKNDWSDARLKGGGDRIECAVRPTTGACDRSSVNSFGLDLSAIYTWRYLDIEVVGLSFYVLAQPSKSVDLDLQDTPGLRLSHASGNRTLVRLGHVGGRYLINDRFEPYARVGFSFAADRVRARDLQNDNKLYRFKRASVLLELRGGVRVHANELLYGYTDIGVGFDITQRGTRPAFELGAGVGVNLHNPLTRKKKPSRRSAHDALPQEL